MWTALVCFLVQAVDERGMFEETGFHIDNETHFYVLDVSGTQLWLGVRDVQDAGGDLCWI